MRINDYINRGAEYVRRLPKAAEVLAEEAARRLSEPPPKPKAPIKKSTPETSRTVKPVGKAHDSGTDPDRRHPEHRPGKPAKAHESGGRPTETTYKAKPGQVASKGWLEEVKKSIAPQDSRLKTSGPQIESRATAKHPSEAPPKPASPAADHSSVKAGDNRPKVSGHPEAKAPVHQEVKPHHPTTEAPAKTHVPAEPKAAHPEVKPGRPAAVDMPDPKQFLEDLYKKMTPKQLQDHITDLRKSLTERADPHTVERLQKAVDVQESRTPRRDGPKPGVSEKAPAPAEHPAVTEFERRTASLRNSGQREAGVYRSAQPAETPHPLEAPKGNWNIGKVAVGGLSGVGMILGGMQAADGMKKMLRGNVAEGTSDVLAGTGNATSGGASLAAIWKPSSVLGNVAMKAGGFANVASGGYRLAEGITQGDAEKTFEGGLYSVSGVLMVGSKAAGPYAAFGSTVYGATRFGMGLKVGGKSGDERVTGFMDEHLNAAGNKEFSQTRESNLKLYEQYKDGSTAKDLTQAVIGLREQIEVARNAQQDTKEMQEQLKELVKRRGELAEEERKNT